MPDLNSFSPVLYVPAPATGQPYVATATIDGEPYHRSHTTTEATVDGVVYEVWTSGLPAGYLPCTMSIDDPLILEGMA